MSRAPFSISRDTVMKKKKREHVQRHTTRLFSGLIHCDTEVDHSVEQLPFHVVHSDPATFRPTTSGPGSTYYIDTVFKNTLYPLLLIENKPRLAKFQPEVRAIFHSNGGIVNPMCRTASNLPLGSHPELKKQLMTLVGKGIVVVNLTPASSDPVVAAIGRVIIHSDNLPILLPLATGEVRHFMSILRHQPIAQKDEPIYTAAIVMTKTASDPPSFKRKREDEGGVSSESIHTTGHAPNDSDKDWIDYENFGRFGTPRSRLRRLPRKGQSHQNKETRKAKIRRLQSMASV